jgi:hypothetical protein
LLGLESGVAFFCEAVVYGLATMLQNGRICVQASGCHCCVVCPPAGWQYMVAF